MYLDVIEKFTVYLFLNVYEKCEVFLQLDV
jgi:hypothetical protein